MDANDGNANNQSVQDMMEAAAAQVTAATAAAAAGGGGPPQPQPDVTQLFADTPGPVRPRRAGVRHEPYTASRTPSQAPAGTVPTAVNAIEHSMATPIRSPAQGCEIDELRRYVDAKFGYIDAQLKAVQEGHQEAEDGAGQWRALMEQRMHLLDGRLTSWEDAAGKTRDELKRMEV